MQDSSWGMGTSEYSKHNMATLKQKIVAKEVLEIVRNGKGNGKGNKSTYGKILRKAGYSRKSSIQPSRVMRSKGVKEELLPVLESLQKINDNAIRELIRRGQSLQFEKYNNLAEGIEKFTKLSQLLQGKPTERVDFKGWTPAELAEYASTGKIPGRFDDAS